MALKTKKGFWTKHGRRGSRSMSPGSYGGYVYERAAPASYPKTPQQSKIGRCARENVKKGMDLRSIHDAVRKCFGKS